MAAPHGTGRSRSPTTTAACARCFARRSLSGTQGKRLALYVGTSGWSYPEWRGVFYPEKLPQAQFLEHYATRLSACEINATFHRQQSPQATARWAAAVPREFRFAVKAHRRLTYRRQLAPDPQTEEAAREFAATLDPLGTKLGCVLLQVPEFIEHGQAALAGLIELMQGKAPFACELQHESWRGEGVAEALAAHGGTVCLREEEGRAPDALPPGPVAYVRLKADRYDDDARQRLRELFEREAAARDVYVFARHKGVPPDDPHTGVGLAMWLLGAS